MHCWKLEAARCEGLVSFLRRGREGGCRVRQNYCLFLCNQVYEQTCYRGSRQDCALYSGTRSVLVEMFLKRSVTEQLHM